MRGFGWLGVNFREYRSILCEEVFRYLLALEDIESVGDE